MNRRPHIYLSILKQLDEVELSGRERSEAIQDLRKAATMVDTVIAVTVGVRALGVTARHAVAVLARRLGHSGPRRASVVATVTRLNRTISRRTP